RQRLAQLLEELRHAGVKTIALDVLLEASQTPRWTVDSRTREPVELVEDDAALAAAIAAHRNVVLAMNVASQANGQAAPAPTDAPEEPDAIEALAAAAAASSVPAPPPWQAP